MNAWKLRLSMAGTLAVIFGLSTLVLAVIMSLAGVFDIITLGILVVIINIAQWLLAPYLVDALYRVRELPESENPQLHQTVKNLSMKSGISKPKLMLAQIPLPNAFAYGSPLSGNRIAVTKGLLDTLDEGEVEAVVGHELGHLKHRDVQVMMVVSFLPALFYYIGFSLMLSGTYQGQRRNEGSSALIGIAFMAFSWILNLFILYLSRLREYYADRHSASVVDNGAHKLSLGLAKIVNTTRRISKPTQNKQNSSAFKALFIADPDRASADSAAIAAMQGQGSQDLVQEILSKKLTFADKLIEALSTHPNIVKRLRALQELS
ncbi:MAG: zinc metalloprotease HtpX [Candidatus Bathyarchaeota archaeon]|nr:zinc metalloprotease HtpX [Candidatus Bathyarchaeota archaeon]